MLKVLRNQLLDDSVDNSQWLQAFWLDFRRRFVSLLGFQFRKMSPALALAVLHNKAVKETHSGKSVYILYWLICWCLILLKYFADISRQELEMQLSQYDLKRLEYYSRNMADYHLIMDLLPTVSKVYCLGSMGETHFSAVQLASPVYSSIGYCLINLLFLSLGHFDWIGIAIQNRRRISYRTRTANHSTIRFIQSNHA